MPRWQPDGVERLQAAAFELFSEQGFERTTVAEIALRAGLTQRTFFNHFADKREVLFGLSLDFQLKVIREIDRSDALPPLDAVVHALQTVSEEMFEGRRSAVIRRHEIIEANPDLQERELSKRAALTDAIAAALEARGLESGTALLTASTGMLVQQTAMRQWTQTAESRALQELWLEARHSLLTTVGQEPDRRVARSRA